MHFGETEDIWFKSALKVERDILLALEKKEGAIAQKRNSHQSRECKVLGKRGKEWQ